MTLSLLVTLVGGTDLWPRTQRRQYVLNRALIAALVKGDDREALTLVNKGADPNTRYEPTPVPSLHELMEHLLHPSPSPVNRSPTALTIICGGEWNCTVPVIGALRGQMPLSMYGTDATQLMKAMLIHGANVNARGYDERTPLMYVSRFGNQDILRLLLDHGANVNDQNVNGSTALYGATLAADKNRVRELLTHGANPNLADSVKTPLTLAQQDHRPDIIALLKHYGAKK